MKKQLSFAIATLFGTGYCPVAPGTAGSLVSLPIIFLTCYYFGLPGLFSLIIFSFIMGFVSTREVLKYTKHDPSFIVIDELIGQSITFISVANILKHDLSIWWVYLAAFVFFRLFDVWKPFPIRHIDKKVTNAFGVILDDIVAGLFATSLLHIIVYIYVIRFKELNELMKLGQ
ncbi:MAG: phosphatidylglycerophosphatase A [Endomicrobiaceae bacterium]|nr:phosphatidylglycerophosphatase A [Endomicrobiaceae bacterium]